VMSESEGRGSNESTHLGGGGRRGWGGARGGEVGRMRVDGGGQGWMRLTCGLKLREVGLIILS